MIKINHTAPFGSKFLFVSFPRFSSFPVRTDKHYICTVIFYSFNFIHITLLDHFIHITNCIYDSHSVAFIDYWHFMFPLVAKFVGSNSDNKVFTLLFGSSQYV